MVGYKSGKILRQPKGKGEVSLQTEKPPIPNVVGEGSIVHPTARLLGGVTIGKNARIDAYATVGTGTNIGNNVHVHAAAWVFAGCTIEADAVIGHEAEIGRYNTIKAGIAIPAGTKVRRGKEPKEK